MSPGLTTLEVDEDYVPQRYGIKISGMGFLLPEGKLSEVVIDYVIHPIPNTQKWFLGMINMRGNLVPVFDIGTLLKVDDKNAIAGDRKLLLLDSSEKAVCILIDDLPTTISLDLPEKKSPNFPDMIAEFTGDVFLDHGQAWCELDIEGFFTRVGATTGIE